MIVQMRITRPQLTAVCFFALATCTLASISVTYDVNLFGGNRLDELANAFLHGDNLILVGNTDSLDFPTTDDAVQGAISENTQDGFLTIMNKDSKDIIYSTYFGGTGSEFVNSAAFIDNKIYMAGSTYSSDLSTTTGAFQEDSAGNMDAFYAVFSTAGDLLYCTYFGGTYTDRASSVAVDSSGNVYLGGYTNSDNFPLKTAFQASQTYQDGFIIKFTSSGALSMSSFLGGNGVDEVTNVLLSGTTIILIGTSDSDSGFPITGDADKTTVQSVDGFFATVENNDLTYCSFFGGSSLEYVNGAFINKDTVLIVGETTSADLPTDSDSLQETLTGNQNGFLATFDLDGTPDMVTYIGGDNSDTATALLMTKKILYVVGATTSISLSFTEANGGYNSTNNGDRDGFIVAVDDDYQAVPEQTTFVGGSDDDSMITILEIDNNSAMLFGQTSSSDLPTNDTYRGGDSDIMIVLVTRHDSDVNSSIQIQVWVGAIIGLVLYTFALL